MEKGYVFLNYVQEDLNEAQQIQDELMHSGIEVFFPGNTDSLSSVKQMVGKIENLIDQNGVMVVVLSKKALEDNDFISNTQLCFEMSGKRQSLVIWKKENLPDDHAITLYYPRSIIVNAARKSDYTFQRIVSNVKRLLGKEINRRVAHQPISKRTVFTLIWIVGLVALLGGIAQFIYSQYQIRQTAIKAAQEPVVINVPFSNESIDQGFIVDESSVPIFESTIDPSKEAPFYFEPAVINKRITFNDPKFENSVDFASLGLDAYPINEENRRNIIQHDGVLQISGLAQDEEVNDIITNINHFYSPSDTSYIGIRFKLEDYLGWSDYIRPSGIKIFTWSMANIDFPFVGIFPSQQTISSKGDEQNTAVLGTNWHTLEIEFSKTGNSYILYLDGKKFDEGHTPLRDFDLMNLTFGYQLQSTTDWMSFSIDEIIYGNNDLIQPAKEAEQANYHYKPTEIFYTDEINNSTVIRQFIKESNHLEIKNSQINLGLPSGFSGYQPILDIPAKKVDATNYFAIKYRVNETTPVSWTNSGYFELVTGQKNNQDECQASISSSLVTAEYRIATGMNDIKISSGSEENFQIGYWHTIEMVILPDPGEDQQYSLFFWHDDKLVGEQAIRNSVSCIDFQAPLHFYLNLFAGDDTSSDISIDFNNLVLGYVPAFGINE